MTWRPDCQDCAAWVVSTILLDNFEDDRLQRAVDSYHILEHPEKFFIRLKIDFPPL